MKKRSPLRHDKFLDTLLDGIAKDAAEVVINAQGTELILPILSYRTAMAQLPKYRGLQDKALMVGIAIGLFAGSIRAWPNCARALKSLLDVENARMIKKASAAEHAEEIRKEVRQRLLEQPYDTVTNAAEWVEIQHRTVNGKSGKGWSKGTIRRATRKMKK
jgi:hypothetical protein